MDVNESLQVKIADITSLGSTMSAMSGIFTAQATAAKVLQQQMEPMRRALEVIAEQAKRWVEMIREAINRMVEPLSLYSHLSLFIMCQHRKRQLKSITLDHQISTCQSKKFNMAFLR
jgi:hypothetical protein